MFIKDLDDALILLYKTEAGFLICGYINTDYVIESKKKTSLIINNIKSVAHNQFATKIQSNSTLPLKTYL
jgi:uncharacterized protein YunC (DUF1805 family)